MDALNLWYTGLQAREKILVLATSLIMIITLLYLVIWEPVFKGLEQQQEFTGEQQSGDHPGKQAAIAERQPAPEYQCDEVYRQHRQQRTQTRLKHRGQSDIGQFDHHLVKPHQGRAEQQQTSAQPINLGASYSILVVGG